MKLSRLFVISLGLSLGFASADESDEFNFTGTVWASGVSETGGWYDANKINNADGDADDNMCYAASAANLIAWWQNGEYGKNLTSVAPKELDDIWQTYIAHNEDYDTGGDPGSALNWWISGTYSPEMAEEWERYYAADGSAVPPPALSHTNGYYFDEYGLTKSDLGDFVYDVWSFGESDMTASELSITLADIFNEGGGISLAIFSDNVDNPLAHAITLWGVEYENGELVKLWLTDSDDSCISDDFDITDDSTITLEPRLFGAAVSVVEDKDGNEKIYFEEQDLYGKDVYITAVFALDATASENWQMVPEPTTATLSLLALAALAAHRRRK